MSLPNNDMKNETTLLPQSAAAFPKPPATAAPRPAVAVCPWPRDSAIEDFVVLARRYSEAEDQLLVGALLPVISASLGRNVHVIFGRRLFCNVYCILAAPAGMRSTVIDLVTHIAKTLLPEAAIFSGFTSASAAFLEYLRHSDRLWLVGEDVLNNWAHDPAGRGVVRQLLALHECRGWRESYLRNKKEDGEAIREVLETTTSVLLSATPSSARFDALEVGDEMRQRFSCYTGKHFARMIYWPPGYNSDELSKLVAELGTLKTLQGEMRLSREAFGLWRELQAGNRRQIEDSANEIHASVLAASPVKTLKLSMLFEACRWLKDRTRSWQIIAEDTLKIAAQHEAGCVEANRRLDGTIIVPSPSGEANIDAINRELDALRQRRVRSSEPEPGYLHL